MTTIIEALQKVGETFHDVTTAIGNRQLEDIGAAVARIAPILLTAMSGCCQN
jgi:hypothetical protein